MSNFYIYLSIFSIAIVTYLIRVLPLLLLRRPIKSRFLNSFLYYAPYVTLATLTFPSILSSTGSFYSSLFGFIVALVLSFLKLGLPISAAGSCISALIVDILIEMM